MTARTHNRFSYTSLLAGAALLFGSGSVFADDAQDQARSMLTGVAGQHVSFPASSGSTAQVDPQIQAQWMLTGKPQVSERAVSNAAQTTVVADTSNAARKLLAGKGS